MNEGTIIAGDQLRDNDKRQNGRIVEVLDVVLKPGFATDGRLRLTPGSVNYATAQIEHVVYHTGKRLATIRADRIYTDGKTRQRGFNLLPRTSRHADFNSPALKV